MTKFKYFSQLRNLENSEITKQCNSANHGDFKGIIQPNAPWHGMKVEMVGEKQEQKIVHIQTSFSEE
jgi:hypothetical protein